MADEPIVIRGAVRQDGATWTAVVEAAWRDKRDEWAKPGFATEAEAAAEVRKRCAEIAQQHGTTMEEIQ